MGEQEPTCTGERVAVLRCPWGHVHLWPADMPPFAATCMAKVASLPNGEWPTCGKRLHVSRYVHGEVEEQGSG